MSDESAGDAVDEVEAEEGELERKWAGMVVAREVIVRCDGDRVGSGADGEYWHGCGSGEGGGGAG